MNSGSILHQEGGSLMVSIIGEDQIRVIVEDSVRKVMRELKENATQIDEYLTQKELCKLLHISMSTIVNWRKAGKLKPHKIGNRILFKREDILQKITEIREFRSVEDSVN